MKTLQSYHINWECAYINELELLNIWREKLLVNTVGEIENVCRKLIFIHVFQGIYYTILIKYDYLSDVGITIR